MLVNVWLIQGRNESISRVAARGREIHEDSGTYRSGVDASVLSSGHYETLAGQEKAICKGCVFGGCITPDDGGNNRQLLWLELYNRSLAYLGTGQPVLAVLRSTELPYVPTGRSCPHAVTGGADDSALVNVPRADEAIP